jgi:1-acyl-sn-glycerol-3-phosphate acyltransferase
MSQLLNGARSLVALLSVGVLFGLGSLRLRLWVLPRYWLRPERRFELVSTYMKWMCRWIFRLLSMGGARFRRVGTLPTGSPVVIVANHQALLDIVQITLMAEPFVPGFVTRKRYGRWVPLVSESLRLLGAPLVEPRGDPRGSLTTIREAVRSLPHGILIFPEGHRSRTGEILPWKRAGLEAALTEARRPVYLVVGDGFWKAGKLVDMLFAVHKIDAYTEALGPFEPPADPGELPAFIAMLRERMVERLQVIRGRTEGRPAEAQPAPAH